MSQFLQISAAGFAATAITYGPARMGFGLFLPQFRETFDLSTRMAGLISSLGFAGFLLGLCVAYALLARYGPRAPVVAGLAAATLGIGLIAGAPGLPLLAAGVFFAMSSAGFAWAPFNNAVHKEVREERRPLALTLISTGTSVGVAAAGAAALALHATGVSWRAGWAVIAGVAALVTVANIPALRRAAGDPLAAAGGPWRTLIHDTALPVYGIALSFGTVSAIYISFAADRLRQAGGLPGLAPEASPAILFLSFGLIGLAGLGTDALRARLGLTGLLRLLQAIAAASLVLVALAPTAWGSLVVSAGLHGAYVMMTSATLSFWTDARFPTLPALSFTAALLAMAAGSVAGPVLAGLVSDIYGPRAMFLATAVIPVITLAALLPRRGETGALPA